jgi:hypothetical protein
MTFTQKINLITATIAVLKPQMEIAMDITTTIEEVTGDFLHHQTLLTTMDINAEIIIIKMGIIIIIMATTIIIEGEVIEGIHIIEED